MTQVIKDAEVVSNVNETNPEQELLVARAQELMDVLNKEPKVELSPFLRFSESGIKPDVRILLVKEKKDESKPADEAVSGGESAVSEEGSSDK